MRIFYDFIGVDRQWVQTQSVWHGQTSGTGSKAQEMSVEALKTADVSARQLLQLEVRSIR
jgi:hypothetical protein